MPGMVPTGCEKNVTKTFNGVRGRHYSGYGRGLAQASRAENALAAYASGTRSLLFTMMLPPSNTRPQSKRGENLELRMLIARLE
jgi:hypothetical protein